MFLRTKNDPSATLKKIPSVISDDLHILGNLVSEAAIDVDGTIEGNVKAEQVTIRENGKIKGDVVAEVIHVFGEVRGLIRAHVVHLHATCHIEGIIMYQSLTVEDGAFVDAKFNRMRDTAPEEEKVKGLSDDDGIIEEKPTLANLRLIG